MALLTMALLTMVPMAQGLANVVNGVEGSFVPVWKSLWSKDADKDKAS